MIYDCAIIGTGPAGIEAALNMKIHNKNFIWIGSKKLSEKLNLAEEINNYPGFNKASGAELKKAFDEHIENMGIEIKEQMVNQIMPMKDHFALMAGADFYEAKTIILSIGVANKNTIDGENEFLGKGVSYCATCDGGLYRGKKIAVVCNSKRFEHEIKYLADLADKVYFFPQYKNPEIEKPNVEILKGRIIKIDGEKRVNEIELLNGEKIEIDGIFCLRNSIALNNLLNGLETDDGHIKVDRQMRTNIKGVYAAGDCTGRPYQYAKAIGEGSVASLNCIEYLDEKK